MKGRRVFRKNSDTCDLICLIKRQRNHSDHLIERINFMYSVLEINKENKYSKSSLKS